MKRGLLNGNSLININYESQIKSAIIHLYFNIQKYCQHVTWVSILYIIFKSIDCTCRDTRKTEKWLYSYRNIQRDLDFVIMFFPTVGDLMRCYPTETLKHVNCSYVFIWKYIRIAYFYCDSKTKKVFPIDEKTPIIYEDLNPLSDVHNYTSGYKYSRLSHSASLMIVSGINNIMFEICMAWY